MSTTRFRRFGLIFGLLATLGVISVGAFTMLRSDAAESTDSKLKQLLNEKLSVLQQVASQMAELHKLRKVGHKEVYEANVAVLRARLEMCETDRDRIAVLEEMLDEARQREAMFAQDDRKRVA